MAESRRMKAWSHARHGYHGLYPCIHNFVLSAHSIAAISLQRPMSFAVSPYLNLAPSANASYYCQESIPSGAMDATSRPHRSHVTTVYSPVRLRKFSSLAGCGQLAIGSIAVYLHPQVSVSTSRVYQMLDTWMPYKRFSLKYVENNPVPFPFTHLHFHAGGSVQSENE